MGNAVNIEAWGKKAFEESFSKVIKLVFYSNLLIDDYDKALEMEGETKLFKLFYTELKEELSDISKTLYVYKNKGSYWHQWKHNCYSDFEKWAEKEIPRLESTLSKEYPTIKEELQAYAKAYNERTPK